VGVFPDLRRWVRFRSGRVEFSDDSGDEIGRVHGERRSASGGAEGQARGSSPRTDSTQNSGVRDLGCRMGVAGVIRGGQ
jgi:hypothetical protein